MKRGGIQRTGPSELLRRVRPVQSSGIRVVHHAVDRNVPVRPGVSVLVDRHRIAVASAPASPTLDLDLDRVAREMSVVGEGDVKILSEVVLPGYLLHDVVVVFKQGAQRVHGSLPHTPPLRGLRHAVPPPEGSSPAPRMKDRCLPGSACPIAMTPGSERGRSHDACYAAWHGGVRK